MIRSSPMMSELKIEIGGRKKTKNEKINDEKIEETERRKRERNQ
jgi:hypothetical protein